MQKGQSGVPDGGVCGPVLRGTSSVLGTSLSLQLTTFDPNGDLLRFAATGLPVGLTLEASTGLNTGSPSAAGSYSVVLAVSDGVNSRRVSPVWTPSVDPQCGPRVWTVTQPQHSANGVLPHHGQVSVCFNRHADREACQWQPSAMGGERGR